MRVRKTFLTITVCFCSLWFVLLYRDGFHSGAQRGHQSRRHVRAIKHVDKHRGDRAALPPVDRPRDPSSRFTDNTSDNVRLVPEHRMNFSAARATHVIYNRVPKSGSSVTLTVIRKLASEMGYTYRTSAVYNNPALNETDQRELCAYITSLPPPAIYDRHIYHVDCSKYGFKNVTHINLVRDPIERAVSHYYFNQYGFASRPFDSSKQKRNGTMDMCIKGRRASCTKRFKQIAFFCGHEYFCEFPTSPEEARRALNQAKKNVESNYLVVGMTEDLQTFFRVLEKLLPRFFSSASRTFKLADKSLHGQFETKKKVVLNAESKEIMNVEFIYDYEFYAFIRKRFYEQVSVLFS